MHVNKAGDNAEAALIMATRGCGNRNFIPPAHSGDFLAFYQNNRVGNFILRRKGTARENSLQSHGESSYWKSCGERQKRCP
jgi:hypothetical protein